MIMSPEENQNLENTSEENPVSVEPKEEVSEEAVSLTGETTGNENAGLPHSSAIAPELAKTEVEETASSLAETTEEEISQTEIPPTIPIQEIPKKPIQTQEIPTKPEIQTIEKIVYKTDPNFIQNLLNKARAKIQERKRKKLDKIMKLFELNPEISNSNIQNLLRTTKRSATRYLNILEKEQKITQVGNAGRSLKYIKKQ